MRSLGDGRDDHSSGPVVVDAEGFALTAGKYINIQRRISKLSGGIRDAAQAARAADREADAAAIEDTITFLKTPEYQLGIMSVAFHERARWADLAASSPGVQPHLDLVLSHQDAFAFLMVSAAGKDAIFDLAIGSGWRSRLDPMTGALQALAKARGDARNKALTEELDRIVRRQARVPGVPEVSLGNSRTLVVNALNYGRLANAIRKGSAISGPVRASPAGIVLDTFLTYWALGGSDISEEDRRAKTAALVATDFAVAGAVAAPAYIACSALAATGPGVLLCLGGVGVASSLISSEIFGGAIDKRYPEGDKKDLDVYGRIARRDLSRNYERTIERMIAEQSDAAEDDSGLFEAGRYKKGVTAQQIRDFESRIRRNVVQDYYEKHRYPPRTAIDEYYLDEQIRQSWHRALAGS